MLGGFFFLCHSCFLRLFFGLSAAFLGLVVVYQGRSGTPYLIINPFASQFSSLPSLLSSFYFTAVAFCRNWE
jgi:hypothetical protein